ncbi:MAG: glycosyltransferase family 4 protein, partial [Planctomycetota bacterium]|nr:glycosyltransferase family 4 protein [Planctomycetota bacterium]
LVANARMPSQRAQSVQLAQAARGYHRAGARVTLLHARRRDTPGGRPAAEVLGALLSSGADLDCASLVAIPCVDWIDLVPRGLQFGPARAQEWSCGRGAARWVERKPPGALESARDVEVAHRLRGREGVAWEVHRVPGGRLRRRWAAEALAAGVRPIAISSGVAEDLAHPELGARDVPVEHDAVDEHHAPALPDRSEARRRLGLDPEQPVVLYAGGLLRWKGVDVLVDAARDPRLSGALVLVVGGMDRDAAALRARAAGTSNVRVDGFRPAGDIPLYLAAADVGVAPNRATPRISSHHTAPLKVFEALASGLPLVVSDLPSLRDVLDEETATFVEAEDAAALAGGIAALLGDPSLRARRATAGRQRVERATWTARARRVLDELGSAQEVPA